MYLTDMLALSIVPRWGIVPHNRVQTVSDHVFRTMVIFIELCWRLRADFTTNDLLAVLNHDINESRTGDVPTPAKADLGIDQPSPVFSGIKADKAFRIADLVEAFTFIERHGDGYHARRVGNSLLTKIKEEAGEDFEIVSKLISEITYEMDR